MDSFHALFCAYCGRLAVLDYDGADALFEVMAARWPHRVRTSEIPLAGLLVSGPGPNDTVH